MIRAAEFTDQGVIVRLHPTDACQTHALTVRYIDGPLIDPLRRAYTNPTTALQAYRGMCTLFAAGYTVAAVVDFAQQHAAQPAAEYELTACEKAA